MNRALFVLILILTCSTLSVADAPPSYRDPVGSRDRSRYDQEELHVSPKPGWRSLPQDRARRQSTTPWWASVLLWVPNRLMDFIDIFRVDVGAGPAVGGVVRFTRHAQAGYRRMLPFSFRIGDFGRTSPFLIETDNEDGSGSTFHQSTDRKVCASEIGVGIDLGLGGYAGICSEELLDFVAGIFFFDLEADDIQSDL